MKPSDLGIYLALACLWGTSFLVLTHVVAAFGWIGAVALRALIAAAVLLVIARASRRRLDFHAGWWPYAVVGATTVAGQLIGLSYATPRIGTAMAAIIVATIPLQSMVISQFWGLERMSRDRILGLLLGIAGIVLLVGFPTVPVTLDFLIGCLVCLAGAFFAAFGSNYASHRLPGADPMELTIGAFASGGIMCLPLLLVVPVPTVPGLSDWAALTVLAATMSALTYTLYFRLVASIGPTRAISVEFVVTVVAVLIGATVLDERLSLIQMAGAAIILTGCALVLGLIRVTGR